MYLLVFTSVYVPASALTMSWACTGLGLAVFGRALVSDALASTARKGTVMCILSLIRFFQDDVLLHPGSISFLLHLQSTEPRLVVFTLERRNGGI